MSTSEHHDTPNPVSAADRRRRQRLLQGFFLVAFAALLWQTLQILASFYTALLGATLVAILVYPLHEWVIKRIGKPTLAAGVTTSLVVLVFIVPVLVFGGLSIKETIRLYPAAQEFFERARQFEWDPTFANLPHPMAWLGRKLIAFLEAWHIDLRGMLLENISEISRKMAGMATQLFKNIAFIILNVFVLTLTLFFFLRDGPQLIQRCVDLLPLAPNHKLSILTRLKVTLDAVIRAVLLVAIIQGLLAGLGFALFGVPFPMFLGALTALLAPIPFVGTASVWVPVVLGLLFKGAYFQAVKVLLWSLLVVGTIDNILRPILIGSKAKIPILLLFFGMLGGIKMYGFTGLLLGPVVIALFLTFIDIYRQEYQWLVYGEREPR